jgi:hypothetical protein
LFCLCKSHVIAFFLDYVGCASRQTRPP